MSELSQAGVSVNETISNMIRKESQRLNGYVELSRKIEEANRHRPKQKTINHQKLRSIGSSQKKHSIYFYELELLDTYFRMHGISLAKELFQPPSVIEALGNSGSVAFLIPSRSRDAEMRVDMSEWDVKSLAEFTYNIGLSSTRQPKLHIQEVPYRQEFFETSSSELVKEPWYQFFTDNHSSVVSISSPRASHSSELMLSTMFGFEPMSEVELNELPFAFVWPEDSTFRSTFSISMKTLSRKKTYRKGLNSVRQDSYLLIANGKVYESQRSGDALRKEYGVLVAKNVGKQLHVCTAGCTGSASLGVARAAREMIYSRELLLARNSQPIWAVIEVDIQPTRKAADPREVIDYRILTDD